MMKGLIIALKWQILMMICLSNEFSNSYAGRKYDFLSKSEKRKVFVFWHWCPSTPSVEVSQAMGRWVSRSLCLLRYGSCSTRWGFFPGVCKFSVDYSLAPRSLWVSPHSRQWVNESTLPSSIPLSALTCSLSSASWPDSCLTRLMVHSNFSCRFRISFCSLSPSLLTSDMARIRGNQSKFFS